uniref:6-phosphofructo-2-kinase domain-containing protein n=1 Tax=Neobodo designis TaxID=312471 RepID=A0A7S1QC40_NEODS|mmetsp:Transcript_38395/g.118631  ORF Transcript_38395/g.118631 Transcript_38395/m.118631 type:complete len:1116 (+) Transcript_38395:62-3409(+)
MSQESPFVSHQPGPSNRGDKSPRNDSLLAMAPSEVYARETNFAEADAHGHGTSLRLRQSLLGQRDRLLERIRTLPPSRAVRVFPVIRSGQVALLVTLLHNKIVSVHERDYNGCTPLHVAAHMGSDEMVQVLLGFGADVRACDALGRTPTDLAHKNGHAYVVRILTQAARRDAQQAAAEVSPAGGAVMTTMGTASMSGGPVALPQEGTHLGATPPTPPPDGSRAGGPIGTPIMEPSSRFVHARTTSSLDESHNASPGTATVPWTTPGGAGAAAREMPPGMDEGSFLEGSMVNTPAGPGQSQSNARRGSVLVKPLPGFGGSNFGHISLGSPAVGGGGGSSTAPPHTLHSALPPAMVDTRPSSTCATASATGPPSLSTSTAVAAAAETESPAAASTISKPIAAATPSRVASVFTSLSDSVSVVICMVGLPGRGKSFISKHVCRFLNWKGIPCNVFNAGDYRRQILGAEGTSDDAFYDPNNTEAAALREKMAEMACEDAAKFIGSSKVAVSVLDATNTTIERRKKLIEYFRTRKETANARLMFIESVCTRQDVIRENILRAKFGNKDFAHVSNPSEVIDSFNRRIKQYEKVYQTLDDKFEPDLSYIRILNVKETVQLHNVSGIIPTRVANFLLNLHPVAFPIYVCRHGETVGDTSGVFGGDDDLTAEGKRFAQALCDFALARADSSGASFTVMYAENNAPTRETLRPLIERLQAAKESGSDDVPGNINVVAERHLLREINYGSFANLTRQEALQQFPRMFQRLFGKTQQKDVSLSGRQRPLIADPPLDLSRSKAAVILDSELSEVRTYLTEPAMGGSATPAVSGIGAAVSAEFPIGSAMLSATNAGASGLAGPLGLSGAASPAYTGTTRTYAIGGSSLVVGGPAATSTISAASAGPPQLVEPTNLSALSPAPMASPMPQGIGVLPPGMLAPDMPVDATGQPAADTGASPVDPAQPAGAAGAMPPSRGGISAASTATASPAPQGANRALTLAEAATASRGGARGFPAGGFFDSHKYPAYNIGYPRGESTRQVVVRLEDVIMSVARCDGPLLIVCPDTPARGLLAYLCDLAPEQVQYVRLPHQAVVEIGTKGDVRLSALEPVGAVCGANAAGSPLVPNVMT